jgi:putative Mg2+ transporter-C (MgtC) family protein
VRFARNDAMAESEMRRPLTDHGFTIANLNYRLDVNLDFFEYRMVIRTNRADNASKLAEALKKIDSLKEFRVSPIGD